MSSQDQEGLQVSVVMATYNRAHLLPELLEAWRLVGRGTKLCYEIIFSDDGSTDSTLEVLRACSDLPLIVLENPHGGAAQARNHAVSVARGDLLIFTGDDIFPEPGYLDQHYGYFLRQGDRYATLGRIEWRPGIQMTYLMKHITEVGCEQFGFVALPPHRPVDFRHFYTSNISLSAKILRQLDAVFDLSFDQCNFEDIELGYRLQKAGLLKIYYAPEICVFHDHVYRDAQKFMNRQRLAGQQLATFKRLQPGLSVFEIHHDIEGSRRLLDEVAARPFVGLPLALLAVRRWLLLSLATFFEARLRQRASRRFERYCSLVYARLFRESFLEGLASGLNVHASTGTVQRFAYSIGRAGFAQIFFDEDGAFSEENSFKVPVLNRVPFRVESILPSGRWGRIRLDPYNGPARALELEGAVHLVDGQSLPLTFSQHNARSGTQWDFSLTEDPWLISDKYPSKIEKIEVRGVVVMPRYRLGVRGVRFVVAKTKAFVRRVCRRVISGVAPLWAPLLHIGGRSIAVQIGTASAVDGFEKVCEPFRSAVRIVGPTYRGAVDYKYFPIKPESCLAPPAFLQAVLALASHKLDFLVVDGGFGPWPKVQGPDWESMTFFPGKYETFAQFTTSTTSMQGRCFSLCGPRGTDVFLPTSEFWATFRPEGNGSLRRGDRAFPLWSAPRRGTSATDGKPIVFVFPTFLAVGGVERNTIEVMRVLQPHYRFVVITWENHTEQTGTLFHQAVELAVGVFAFPQIADTSSYLALLRYLRVTYNPQAVWVPNSNPWYFDHLVEIRKIFRKSVMVAQDAYDFKYGWINHYDRPGVAAYDHIIAINTRIRETLETRFRIDSSKISLIYPAIHTKRIRTVSYDREFDRDATLRSFGLEPEKRYFTFVGRLADQKRPLLFVELACRILSRFPMLGFNLVGDGPLGDAVRVAVEASGKKESFTLIPYTEHVYEYMRAMDGLVLTSEYEGLPIVSIEAMCLGVPVFSTPVGDLPLFVEKTGGGLICHNQSLDGLSSSFFAFLDNLQVFRSNAMAAREESIDFFSSERAASLTGKLFEKKGDVSDV